jgi:hypothetical protein
MALYLDPLTYPDVWNTVRFGKLNTPGKCNVSGWSRNNEYDIKVGKGTAGATETLKGQPPAKGSFEFWAWTPAHFQAWNPILTLLAYKPGKGTASTTGPTGDTGQSFQGGVPDNRSTGGNTSSGGGGAIPAPGNTTGKEDPSDKAFGGPKTPPALSKDDAIPVYHPALADINVTSIIPPEELGQWEQDGEASGMWKRTIKAVEFMQAGNQSIATTPTGAGSGDVPGFTGAGGQEGSAPPNAAGQAQGASKDAQGAWGAP